MTEQNQPQQYPPGGWNESYAFQPPPTKPKKRHRVFLWVFLAIQALFVVWIISGAASASGTPSDCGTLDADTCNTAANAGAAIGVFIIVVLWCIADFLLAVGYTIYRLARRP